MHLDVLLKLFDLSLEDDAIDWFMSLVDNSINTWEEWQRVFLERWEEGNDNRFLLATLNGAKGIENEIVEAFNKRFDQIAQKLHKGIMPPGAAILIYYVDAFDK